MVLLASAVPVDIGRLAPADPTAAAFDRIVVDPDLRALTATTPMARDADESWLAVLRRALART